MTTSITPGRGLAIAAGVVLLSGALGILFSDVIAGAPFTLKHYLTLVIVAGTLLVGHLAEHAWRQRHFASVVGFAALFLAGTGLVVYSSVGRQAETSMASTNEHDKQANERLQIEADLAEDRATLKESRQIADRECASGIGKKCTAKRATVAFYEKSIKGLEARHKALDPEKPVEPAAERLATVAAAFGYDKHQVKGVAVLAYPYFVTLFFEFGTIWSFGFAFSPKRQRSKLPAKADTMQSSFAWPVEVEASPVELSKRPRDGGSKIEPSPKPKRPNDPKRRMTRDEVLTDLMVRNATGRSFRSQEDAAAHYGVSPSRFSEWSKEWEVEGSIPKRRKVGRCKMFAN